MLTRLLLVVISLLLVFLRELLVLAFLVFSHQARLFSTTFHRVMSHFRVEISSDAVFFVGFQGVDTATSSSSGGRPSSASSSVEKYGHAPRTDSYRLSMAVLEGKRCSQAAEVP